MKIFDIFLIAFSVLALVSSFVINHTIVGEALAVLSFLGLIPVAYSAIKALLNKQLSVDLLATIALVFSLLSHEWFSATFITLMLAFARLFDRITSDRTKKTIQSLMKYHVETVRIQTGETIKEINIKEIKIGDRVIIESGDRVPVDGKVVSGNADIDESTLTGESELVPKKVGDKVFSSTMNESGSLVVVVEKIGADTTLSRIIALIEEAGRNKNKAEKMANRFTAWYIAITLTASVVMFLIGLPTKVILAVLLVICADDIAVAVPLTFTAGMMHAAKRGVLIKGSTVFEQLAKVKYILTDKTGTLTRGRPKVFTIKSYGQYDEKYVVERFGMGASESKHMVSKAILEYVSNKHHSIHAPHHFEEVSGQGIIFSHDKEKMLLGRLSFLEREKCHILEEMKNDINLEKDAGHGISILAVNNKAIGLLSYVDELRPRVREVIAETEDLGVKEWHMLTGDNERVAKNVANELNIKHYHANMTPETKVDFIRNFEKTKNSTVAFIGDGVNDAASLALADVSIAMGSIGSDAAIEAADITIMKDNLSRLPEVIALSKSVKGIMLQNFLIWAITNITGLALVVFGIIGPVGAATYNFLTDFVPIGNALRVGRRKVTDVRHPLSVKVGLAKKS